MWTPTTGSAEAYAFAGSLGGVVPFAVDALNRGPLDDEPSPVGVVNLVFPPMLGVPPESCVSEAIRSVWVNGEGLRASQVTPPVGWAAYDLVGSTGWPGTCVLLVSPSVFLGLSVEVDFGGSLVRRVVGLTEWRGVPGAPVISVSGSGGPGDPGGPGEG